MNIKQTLLTFASALGAIAIVTTITFALPSSTLEPQGTPGENTQYSLNDIYNKILNINATPGTKTAPDFDNPLESFRTLTEIYTLLETEQPKVIAENIKDGVTLFGVLGEYAGSGGGLPATGQTTSYTANDDGDIQSGAALSYTDNNDGTVTDNVTGLVWQQDGAYKATSWQDAIDYCANNVASLPGSGWRLPNYKELVSILDLGRVSPAIDPVFTDTQSNDFWSSTTHHDITGSAWVVAFGDGHVYSGGKTGGWSYARCVR